MPKRIKIDGYSFGRMSVGGREYTSDLILYTDGRIQDNWRRAQGHNLLPGDLTSVLGAVPEKLIIGTGASGLIRVSEGVVEACEKRGIEIEACPTPVAVTRFNESAEEGRLIAACFHLTIRVGVDLSNLTSK